MMGLLHRPRAQNIFMACRFQPLDANLILQNMPTLQPNPLYEEAFSTANIGCKFN
jgi:hypothetical protein